MMMKYGLVCSVILGTMAIADPVRAQFSSFGTGLDSCSSICVKLDLGSANNDNSFGGFNSGFNSGSSSSVNNIRWQLGITWRPNPPEVAQGEADRVKQRLDDNRSLMLTLADAIAQNRTELARGIAILLAPRLGYKDPRILLAEMKEGSMNIGSTKVEIKPTNPTPNLAPPFPPATGATPNNNNILAPSFGRPTTPPANDNSTPPIELR
jgi:hypothetical protein